MFYARCFTLCIAYIVEIGTTLLLLISCVVVEHVKLAPHDDPVFENYVTSSEIHTRDC